jgi:hypothetical protein
MKQPLWRFVIHFMLLVFAVHRAAAAVVLYLDDADRALVVGLALQCVAGVVTSFAVLFDARWVTGALVITAVLIAGTALYGTLGAGAVSMMAALGQTLVAALAAGGLVALLRHERGQ